MLRYKIKKWENKNLHWVLFLVLLSCVACNKWLDVRPVTEVPEETMYVNEQGFFEVLGGIYTKMGSSNLYGGELTMGLLDALAQRYTTASARAQYPAIMGTPTGEYDYQADGARNGFFDPVWIGLYNIIGNTNNLLEHVDQKQNVFGANNFNIVKGQALGLRAFLHFDLLRLYAPAPAIAGSATYIPYVKAYNPVLKPKLTVNAVMDSCLKDLDQAQELLAVDKNMRDGNAPQYLSYTRNKLNYYAVLGLKARIYLYKQQPDSAFRYARMVLDAVPSRFQFATKQRVLNGDRTFVSEHLFSLLILDIRNIFNRLFVTSQQRLAVTQEGLNRIYENKTSDFRFIDHWRSGGAGAISFRKFSQDEIRSQDSVSYAAQMPLLRLSEMYYIAAETTVSRDSAVQYLNLLRTNRGLAGPANALGNLDANQLREEIQKEYLKEFYAEGQLFYYYKRRNLPMIVPLEGGSKVMPVGLYTWPIPLVEQQVGN